MSVLMLGEIMIEELFMYIKIPTLATNLYIK